MRKNTDRAIIGLFGGNLFETPQFLYNAENYLFCREKAYLASLALLSGLLINPKFMRTELSTPLRPKITIHA